MRGDLNKNWGRRDSLLEWKQYKFIKDNSYMGGIKSFTNLDIKTLETLINEHFVYLDECQNSSPTIKEFFDFMSKYPQVKAHGYVVGPNRSDYRLSIEGLVCNNNITKKLLIDFSNYCHQADAFEVGENYLYSWWD